MKYLLIAPGYPNDKNNYSYAFIHSRVRCYLERGMDIDIFVFKKIPKASYSYEGVKVVEGNLEQLKELMINNKYEKILIHFVNYQYIKDVIKNRKDSNIIIWVHGAEALRWYRRLFLFNIKNPLSFFKYIFTNTIQLHMMRKLIKKHQDIIKFIFVSNWMKEILETDTFTKGKIINYEIVPNIVNEQIFNYTEKTDDMRYNILSIRSYDSKKYANDISVKAVLELSKRKNFEKYKFEFYGDGKLFNKTLKPILNFKNVKVNKKFLTQKEISEKHKENGIFLVPTRQDAQGVSMCEAMSSGLVPISSNNTAIPEFLNDKCGFLTDNYIEIANCIEKLSDDINLFRNMSKQASKEIVKKCGKDNVINKEIQIIKEQ